MSQFYDVEKAVEKRLPKQARPQETKRLHKHGH